MSKGNDRLTLRITASQLQAILSDLKAREESNDREVITISEWIRAAIQEKLDHMKRSRQSKRKPTEGDDFKATLNDFIQGNPDVFPSE